MFAAALAHLLDSLGIVTYTPDGTAGDCYLDHRPSGPDEAVFLIPTGAFAQPTRTPYDIVTVQVVTRGPRHQPLPSVDRQTAIFDALACLDGTLIADGTPHEVWVAGITPQGTARGNPVSLGQDANQRPEHASNWRAHVRSPSTHRPAIGAN